MALRNLHEQINKNLNAETNKSLLGEQHIKSLDGQPTKCLNEQSIESSDEISTKSTGEQSTKSSGKPSTKSSDEQSTKSSYEISNKSSDEISTKSMGEQSTKTSGKPSTKSSDEQSTQSSGEPSTQSSDEQSTMSSGEPSTQSSDEISTKSMGEQSTKSSGKPSTKSSDEQSTQSSGEPSTQSSDEQSTMSSGEPSVESVASVCATKRVDEHPAVIVDIQPTNLDEQSAKDIALACASKPLDNHPINIIDGQPTKITDELPTKSLDEQLIDATKAQDLSLVKELISKGASANFVCRKDGAWGSYDKETALHVAIQGLTHKITYKQRTIWKEIILFLLKHGANPNETKDSYDWRGCGSKSSPYELLCQLTKDPDPDILSEFLASGLDPNLAHVSDRHTMRTDGGSRSSLLHYFIIIDSLECAATLLNAGASVEMRSTENMVNERGYCKHKSETPLHIAISKGKLNMCILLLAKGADVNALEHHSDTEICPEIVANQTTNNPRDEAYKTPWKTISVKSTALHVAIKNHDNDILTLLLLCNADPKIPFKSGQNEISTLEYFRNLNKSTVLSTYINRRRNIEQALDGKLDRTALISSLYWETKLNILEMLEKIKSYDWDLGEFSHLYETLKYLRSVNTPRDDEPEFHSVIYLDLSCCWFCCCYRKSCC